MTQIWIKRNFTLATDDTVISGTGASLALHQAMKCRSTKYEDINLRRDTELKKKKDSSIIKKIR